MTALIGTEFVAETPPKKDTPPKYSWILLANKLGYWITTESFMADLVKIKLNCKRINQIHVHILFKGQDR